MILMAGLVLALAFPGSVAAAELTSSSSSSTATLFPPPGGATDVIPTTSLPACSSVTVSTPEAFGLGWKSLTGQAGVGAFSSAHWKPTPPAVTPTDRWYEYAASLPCRAPAANTVQVMQYSNWIVGDGASFAPRGAFTFDAVCYDPATGLDTKTTKSSTVLDVASSDMVTILGSGVGACPYLRSITLKLSGADNGNLIPGPTSVWKPSFWIGSTSGWTPATTPGEIAPLGAANGIESFVSCLVDSSGADPLAVMINFAISVARLPQCLFTPLGWDRAQLIPAALNSGPVGALQTAYQAAIPAVSGCGVIATIPTLGAPVVLNTCAVDFAPAWVKVGLQAVVIFGLYILIVGRFLWSIGTK